TGYPPTCRSLHIRYLDISTVIATTGRVRRRLPALTALHLRDCNLRSLDQLVALAPFALRHLAVGDSEPVAGISFWKLYAINRLTGLKSLNGETIGLAERSKAERAFAALNTFCRQIPTPVALSSPRFPVAIDQQDIERFGDRFQAHVRMLAATATAHTSSSSSAAAAATTASTSGGGRRALSRQQSSASTTGGTAIASLAAIGQRTSGYAATPSSLLAGTTSSHAHSGGSVSSISSSTAATTGVLASGGTSGGSSGSGGGGGGNGVLSASVMRALRDVQRGVRTSVKAVVNQAVDDCQLEARIRREFQQQRQQQMRQSSSSSSSLSS
ncbi:hypothetical protein PTSG_10333, partial [Salpingoeca rosetta]